MGVSYAPVKLGHHELWGVPIKQTGNEYRVYVSDNMTRVFDTKTLPNCIKDPLSMIIAMSEALITKHSPQWMNGYWSLRIPVEYPPQYETIGWKIGKIDDNSAMYTVALSYEELLNIRGET